MYAALDGAAVLRVFVIGMAGCVRVDRRRMRRMFDSVRRRAQQTPDRQDHGRKKRDGGAQPHLSYVAQAIDEVNRLRAGSVNVPMMQVWIVWMLVPDRRVAMLVDVRFS